MPAASNNAAFRQRLAAACALAHDGRMPAALAAMRDLVGAAPQSATARHMLALFLHQTGDSERALAELEVAVALAPDDAGIANLRADALLALERPGEAAAAARAALALEPDRLSAQISLGLALLAARQTHEAQDVLAHALQRRPELVTIRRALVRCRLLAGQPDPALADALYPALLDSTAELADMLAEFIAAGASSQHAALLRARAERHPHDHQAALALAAALHQLNRPGEALIWCERTLALRPGDRTAMEIRAAALVDRGDVEAGLAIYRELSRSGDAGTAARHLVLMHYDPAQDNETLFAAHRDYAQRHLHAFGMPFARAARDPGRVLRIGWLSPRFTAGPVATFLGGLLAGFDRTRHRHLLISLQPGHDETTQQLHALADETVDASGLDDARLLQRLRDLELDVLVDLAGHATWNRIGVIARRVAPLQMCWLDWFDTTGVPAMDAWISDAWLTPADSAQRYTERVVRLAAGRYAYTPSEDAPAATRLGGGAVVFASFNRLAKLNDAVVDAWAAILQRAPGSRLALRARHLAEPATRAHVAARFERRGVDVQRLDLGGHLPYRELLAAYRQVDIALDPFPFSGCTTTCDASWMGCPTVTLPGATFVSRQSASLAWRLGRPDWVARDRADYVERALALATDIDSLRAQRTNLREAMRLHLCDARAQARDFAAALRELWCERCVAAR